MFKDSIKTIARIEKTFSILAKFEDCGVNCMNKVDLIVSAPHFYTMEGEGVGYKGNTSMAIDRGKIVAIGNTEDIKKEYCSDEKIDLENQVVLPGFIDAHMHTGDCILRGLAQDTNYWMMYGYGPFANVTSAEERETGSQLAIIEAIKVGTTTFGDYENDMDLVCQFIDKVGVRGHITSTIREAKKRTYNPGELYEFDENMGQKLLKECLELYDKWHGKDNGRIRVLFGPQGPDFLSKELLFKVRELAIERKTKIHMHTQQGDRETAQVMMRYNKRPIAWLDEIGYLDNNLIAVHLTDANEDEAALVAKRGASMILCSGSIGIIDGIVPPAKAFHDAGGNVALGSDQAPGNNCHNIFNEMKLTALFNKIRYSNPETMPAWEVLRMATIEGARAVGLGDKVGSLEVGKQADFIAVDLTKPSMMPLYTNPMRNIVPNLVYSARGEEVSLVAVDGKIIYKDGKILTINEEEILSKVEGYAVGIGERAAEEFWRINGTNAQFMKQQKL